MITEKELPAELEIFLPKHPIMVMLVDDQAIIAEALRRLLLEDKDINFHYCMDGTKAEDNAVRIRPTVILLDLVMPDIDGLTLVRNFRKNPATCDIPIIVLSTKEDPEVKAEAFSLGANDYLVKLPDKAELIARIRYHSKSYINMLQRDDAFRSLQESQRQLEALNVQLLQLSSTDGLTGISNRRTFDEQLAIEWRRGTRDNTSLSLIMIDIDFFKLYNDSLGHQTGDDGLKTVAMILKGSLKRVTDMAARYGGEEFVALLPNTEPDGAMNIAEIIRANIEEAGMEHPSSDVSDYVTISAGVASIVPNSAQSPEKLITAADQALYLAKHSGRNRVELSRYSLQPDKDAGKVLP